MSDQSSRRDILRGIAVTAATASLEPAAAQHVHETVAAEKKNGFYKPKVFTEAEWKSVGALAEVIIPGAATKGGAAEFVDLICSENPRLAAAWTGGLAWLAAKLGKPFQEATAEEQKTLLDKIAFRTNDSPELAPGIRFFDLARRMVVDAYYTSAAGVAELGYLGNKGMSEFKVPEESIAYALRRSPFA